MTARRPLRGDLVQRQGVDAPSESGAAALPAFHGQLMSFQALPGSPSLATSGSAKNKRFKPADWEPGPEAEVEHLAATGGSTQ